MMDGKSDEAAEIHARYASNSAMLEGLATAKGIWEGTRQVLYMQGLRRFGKPDAAIVAALETIKCDLSYLSVACMRMVDPDVRTWEDLMRNLILPRDDSE